MEDVQVHTHLFSPLEGSWWCSEVSCQLPLKQERSVHRVSQRPLNKHLYHVVGDRDCCSPLMCGLSFKPYTALHLVIAAPVSVLRRTDVKKETAKVRLSAAAGLADMASPNYRANIATLFTLLFAWLLTNPVVIPSTSTRVSP